MKKLCALLGLLCWASVASAQDFATITSVTSTTSETDLWPVSLLAQGPGVGFDASAPFNQIPEVGRWVTAAPGGFPNDYFVNPGVAPVITFDLGQEHQLEQISFWGYDEGNANGVSEFSLRFATEAEGLDGFGDSITFNPTYNPTIDSVARQNFDFGQAVTARYVELTALDNFFSGGGFGPPPGGDRVGIGEIAFEVSELPAPITSDFYDISSVESSTAATDLFPVSNLIQGPGVGFDDVGPHEKLIGGPTGNWVTAAPGGFPNDYLVNPGEPPVITVDLGEDQLLGEISFWGYDDTNANGVSEFSLRFATDAEGTDGLGSSITYNPTFNPILNATVRQSFDFAELVTARYVEITATDNFFSNGGSGPPPGGDRVGFGEIAFEVQVAAQVIPEPSSTGAFLALCGLAALRRRR